tara:strand:- start:734 stop:970 length:237 start_codon:yes stop_codon:yes gene_type:complete
MRTKAQVEEELAAARRKAREAERAVDTYEATLVRSCRPGQGMHIQAQVDWYCEELGVWPLLRRERELEQELETFSEAA